MTKKGRKFFSKKNTVTPSVAAPCDTNPSDAHCVRLYDVRRRPNIGLHKHTALIPYDCLSLLPRACSYASLCLPAQILFCSVTVVWLDFGEFVLDLWPRELFSYFLNNDIANNLKLNGQISMQFYTIMYLNKAKKVSMFELDLWPCKLKSMATHRDCAFLGQSLIYFSSLCTFLVFRAYKVMIVLFPHKMRGRMAGLAPFRKRYIEAGLTPCCRRYWCFLNSSLNYQLPIKEYLIEIFKILSILRVTS